MDVVNVVAVVVVGKNVSNAPESWESKKLPECQKLCVVCAFFVHSERRRQAKISSQVWRRKVFIRRGNFPPRRTKKNKWAEEARCKTAVVHKKGHVGKGGGVRKAQSPSIRFEGRQKHDTRSGAGGGCQQSDPHAERRAGVFPFIEGFF